MNTQNAMSMINCSVGENMNFTTSGTTYDGTNMSCWDYWQNCYYPYVVRESYPVYIQERAKDKAKHAYEVVKILKDKKLAKLDKVSDFIDLMDELIKIL